MTPGMSLEPGTLLRDRYQIVRLIKSGGMGSVCEARDTNLANSTCAIKEILESALVGPDGNYIRETFEKEMRALVELDHPCIPKVRDFFQDGDRRYIVMEFIKGQSLEDETSEHKETTGRGLPPGKVVADMLCLLETVAYLHHLKPPLLHRDIKPANIIRDEKTGRIKLVDFGLAKAVDTTLSPQTMVGTLGFCAPEQLSGKAETRSDLYSVAATMYHMLTGHPPQLSFDPLQLQVRGLRPGLEQIIARGSEPCASDRYHRAEDMAADLRAWQSGVPPAMIFDDTMEQELPDPSVVLPTSALPTNQWVWVGVAVAALGLGLIVGQVAQKDHGISPNLPPERTSSALPSPNPLRPTPTRTVDYPGVKSSHASPSPVQRRRPKPTSQPEATSKPEGHPSVSPSKGSYVPSLGEDNYPRATETPRRPTPIDRVAPHRPPQSTVIGMSYDVEALQSAHPAPGRLAEFLNNLAPMKEDWQFEGNWTREAQERSFQKMKRPGFIVMRGPNLAGGYFLRYRRHQIIKLTMRPAPQDAGELLRQIELLKSQ